jgi:hypothetical protein
MALAIVNPGFTYVAMLVLALLAALKGKSGLWPGHLEKALLIALLGGLFVGAMLVFAEAFPPLLESAKQVFSGLDGYMGL